MSENKHSNSAPKAVEHKAPEADKSHVAALEARRAKEAEQAAEQAI